MFKGFTSVFLFYDESLLVLDAFRPEIEALLANGSTQRFIAHRYGTTEGNLHNWMRKQGLLRSRKAESKSH